MSRHLSLKVGALLIATYRLSQLPTLHAYLVRNRPNTEWLPLDQLEALNWADLADTFSFPAAIENQIQHQINAQSVQGDLAGRDVHKRDTNTAGRDIHIKNVGEEHHHHHGGQQIDSEAMWETLAAMPLDHVPDRGSVPPGSFFRMRVNLEFVGRETELLELAASMNPAERSGQAVAIATTGLGGIGKTQLAAEFCHRYGQYFQGGVFWINFEFEETARADLAQIAPRLNPEWESLELDAQVDLVLNDVDGLAAELPRLLIFDNLEDPQLLKKVPAEHPLLPHLTDQPLWKLGKERPRCGPDPAGDPMPRV